MKLLNYFGLILAFIAFSSPCALAGDSGWAVVGKVGTEGIGADVHRVLVDRVLNLRAGVSFFGYSTDISNNGINYVVEPRLGAIPVALDVYPFRNWFRVAGGIVINLNQADGTAVTSQGQITINGHPYPADQLGQLNATLRFNRAAPYLGFGFGNPIGKGKRWSVYLDLGGMYQGRPEFLLSTTQNLPEQIQKDLAVQQQKVENDVARYRFFPILQFGVGYHF